MQEDDGVMVNLATPRSKQAVVASTPGSTPSKKDKYSRSNRKNQREQRVNRSINYGMEVKNEQENQTQSVRARLQPKRERDFEQQDTRRDRSSLKGHKRQKKELVVKEQEPKIEQINADIAVPEQLKPVEKESLSKIDTNSLEQHGLNSLLADSLARNGIEKLTDIQHKCYKPLFQGKNVIAKASTGSGKTLAYLIPLLNQYMNEKIIRGRDSGTVLLIVCPSRELCVQGERQVLRCLKRAPFIVPGCLLGGQQTNHQKQRLRKGVNVLFATPGRLLYHLKNTQSFKVSNMKAIVFEEADRTLDMGFHQNVNQILELIEQKVNVEYAQKILVSAHYNEKVEGLIGSLGMQPAVKVGFEVKEEHEQDQKQINISPNVKQQYVLVSEEERITMLVAYLRMLAHTKVMIFVNTIDEVEFLDYLLSNMCHTQGDGQPTQNRIINSTVFKIHGDLDQKYRSQTYFGFRKATNGILISTEVASRGLDFPDLTHIILFDVPPTLTDYGNRVGRTARYNSSGVSLLMLHYQESDYAQQIRYYAPSLQPIMKQLVFGSYDHYLTSIGVNQNTLQYLQGIVRSMLKNDDEKYQLGHRAYVSMLRAYAKMKNKHIFAVKKLDLKSLGRCFGLNSGGAAKKYTGKSKDGLLQSQRKKRKIDSVRKLEVEQYL